MSLASVIRYVNALDTSSTTGAGKTGLAFGDFTAKYLTEGGTLTSLTTETITTLGTYQAPTSSAHIRIKEVNSADPTKGAYEVHFHDSQVASAGKNLWLWLSATGAKAQPLWIPLADLSGRLPAALTSDGNIKADTLRVGGTLQTAGDLFALMTTVAGYLDTEVAAILAAVDTEVAAIKAKTDNLPSDPADASDIASSFSTVNTKLDTIDDFLDTEIAAIKSKTDNLPSDPADASDIAASFATVNTKLDTIAGYLDTEIAAILAAVDTEVAAIKAKTDNLPSDPADQSAIEAAIAALNDLSQADVRAAVGLASANLDTQLGTIAGYLDTEIAAILAAVDTEVAAIKAKTDNLPSDPADASDIASSFGSLTTLINALNDLSQADVRAAVGLASPNLDTQLAALAAAAATIAGYLDTEVAAILAAVDTEVAAIKAKTDNLPSDPADQSAVEAAIAAAWTTQPSESYRATGVVPTRDQMLLEIMAGLHQFDITAGVKSVRNVAGSAVKTFQLNDDTNPTAIEELS